MKDIIINIMNQYIQYGYIIIALLILIENVFPPIPSEVILTLGGFMTTYTKLNIWGVIFSATIGSILGAFILYGIGRLLSAERLGKILDGRIGKILHFKKDDVFKACDWFNSRGKATVLICRCIPIVRSLISIPAGMAKMDFGIFLLLTSIGSFIWNTVLVYLGVYAGASWEKIVAGTGVYQTVTIVILGIAAIAAVIWYLRFRKKHSDK
jgi:LPXTG-motif cell wall-anchored protein